MKKTFGQHLQQLMDKHRENQTTLAKKLHVSQGLIGFYLRDERFPRKRNLEKIANFFSESIDMLLSYQYNFLPRQTDQKLVNSDIELENVESILIPIINWEAAIYGEDAVKHAAATAEGWIAVPADKFSEKSYALRMKGDAMSSTNPAIKSLGEGEMIACDPTQKPTHRKLVIAALPGAREAICRRYIEEAGEPYLTANNPTWPMIKVTPDIKICALVIARLDYEL